MKTIFKTAGAILAAGVILAACGSSSSSPAKAKETTQKAKGTAAVVKPGWVGPILNPQTGVRKLKLPYGGYATPTIAAWATPADHYAFYQQLINPKDWRYSATFGHHIFVGPYGNSYYAIRDAKVRLMDLRYAIEQFAARTTSVPSTVAGFNYRSLGQWPTTDPTLLSTGVAQLNARYGSATLTPDVPSEATIIEAPVGEVTPTEAQAPKTYPTVAGVCVPHALALMDGPTAAFVAPYNNTHAVYAVIYGPAKNSQTSAGVQRTTSCAF